MVLLRIMADVALIPLPPLLKIAFPSIIGVPCTVYWLATDSMYMPSAEFPKITFRSTITVGGVSPKNADEEPVIAVVQPDKMLLIIEICWSLLKYMLGPPPEPVRVLFEIAEGTPIILIT